MPVRVLELWAFTARLHTDCSCAVCGQPMENELLKQRYCSNTGAARAYRQRVEER
jgi:hypothetical protein